MMKSKASAALSLILVFVSGALLGVLAHRAYVVSSSATGPTTNRKLSPADWRKRNLAEMRTRLKLDDQQATQLEQIFDRVDEDFRQVGSKRRAEDQASPGTFTDRIKNNLADAKARLGLDDRQLTQVDQVIDQVNQEIHQVVTKRRAEDQAYQAALVKKIDGILRQDQQVLYKQLRDEREKERENRKQQGPGGPPPPGGPPAAGNPPPEKK
jgi:succinate dehydrogenase flavin-adding protein (antitoxin of CptAB toxin-antitoxin module)